MRSRSSRHLPSRRLFRAPLLLALVSATLTLGAAEAVGADARPSGGPSIQAYGEGSQWDAHVREDMPNGNFGTSWTVDSLGSPARRGYLMFDVQGVTVVEKAMLSLRFLTGNAGTTIVLRRVPSTSWGEMTMTWNTAPGPGAELATVTVPSDLKVSIDVTSAVTGNGRVSFMFSSTGGYGKTWSREAGAEQAPRLFVTNAAPPPPPPPPPAPPVNIAPPQLSGIAQVGETLSATSGTWSGTTPMSFDYRWRRCNSKGVGCSSISGATASTYALVAADAGRTLRTHVTAGNALGSATATSTQSAVVQNPPSPPPPPPPPPPRRPRRRATRPGSASPA